MAIPYLERKIISDIRKRIGIVVNKMLALQTTINNTAYSMSEEDMLYYQKDAVEYVKAVEDLEFQSKVLDELLCELEEYTAKRAL